MIEQRYPEGWDEKRVRDVIAHYDAKNEDEIEDALSEEGHCWMLVPHELVHEVTALIARRKRE